MKIGAKIRTLRKKRGMSINELAAAADSDVGNISRLERDMQGFSGQMLEKISVALNVPVSMFFEESSLRLLSKSERAYPLISWVTAGVWPNIKDLNLDNTISYSCPVACSEKTFVLKVQGASMEPVFHTGDLIFVDPKAEALHESYIIARLKGNDEATFKQLIIENGKKYLKPMNPHWPEQIVPINGNCTIIGTVVFSGKTY